MDEPRLINASNPQEELQYETALRNFDQQNWFRSSYVIMLRVIFILPVVAVL